jgi:hypothetical protein
MIPLATNGTCRRFGGIPVTGPEIVSWTVIYRDRSENAAHKNTAAIPAKAQST